MSWIIGVIGKDKDNLKEKILSLSPETIIEFEENDLFIKSGGNSRTCFFSQTENNNERFLAVGVGIEISSKQNTILDSTTWANFKDLQQIQELNGHFVLIRWNENELKIFTDILGLRDIFIHKYSEGTFIFSTRADWLAKIIKPKLDIRQFGSRWLLFNQISSKSVFEGIERVCCGSKIEINRGNYQLSKTDYKWQPSFQGSNYSLENFSSTLDNLCLLPFTNNKKISISLSGGMDSRVILSYLLKSENKNWDSHTFGDINHPDSLIANQISNKLKIPHEQINLSFPTSIDECLKGIKDYTSQTIVNNAASGFIQLRNYNSLSNRNDIIIDGGFGEIWRREFFNRLFITGKSSLKSKNAKEIIRNLTIHRADIFNEDVKKIMLDGSIDQINNVFSELPDMELIGLENFIDLFALKTRLVNFYSYEQPRLDNIVTSYMPFVQPILLKNLFNVSLSQRKNGKLFKNLIEKNFPSLKSFQLAKGENSYPFRLNTLQSRIWNAAYKKIGLKLYHESNSKKLIDLLNPYILDAINSKKVIDSEYYNVPKLNKLSDSLRKKEMNQNDIHEIDWWLAFELFRESITQE